MFKISKNSILNLFILFSFILSFNIYSGESKEAKESSEIGKDEIGIQISLAKGQSFNQKEVNGIKFNGIVVPISPTPVGRGKAKLRLPLGPVRRFNFEEGKIYKLNIKDLLGEIKTSMIPSIVIEFMINRPAESSAYFPAHLDNLKPGTLYKFSLNFCRYSETENTINICPSPYERSYLDDDRVKFALKKYQ